MFLLDSGIYIYMWKHGKYIDKYIEIDTQTNTYMSLSNIYVYLYRLTQNPNLNKIYLCFNLKLYRVYENMFMY